MSTRRRRPGDASAPLIFALVALGCVAAWVVWLGAVMLADDDGSRAAGGVLTAGGAAVLVAAGLLVTSLLRGPTRIVAHDATGTHWSLRGAPVPLRLASSAALAPGSRGEALAAQVVRAATRPATAPRVDRARAVLVLRQVLEAAQGEADADGCGDDAEWSRVRAAVVDLTLRASDHPPHPVTLLPWEEHLVPR